MAAVNATEEHDVNHAGQLEQAQFKLSVVPYRHTKVLHLIRHGEGFHNVAGRKNHDNYKSWDYEDAHLTAAGWHQAHQVQRHIRATGLKVDVVLVSPLTRALETAVGCFGNHDHEATVSTAAPASTAEAAASSRRADSNGGRNGDGRVSGTGSSAQARQQLLMVEVTDVEGRRAAHPAVAANGAPPFVAIEECREHLGLHPCDRRLPLAAKRAAFPAVDFSQVVEEEDVLWLPDHRESKAEIMARGLRFLQLVMSRSEHSIAVVSHSSFLHFMLTNFGQQDSTVVQGELHRWFENCELRSMVVADHGALAPSSADPFHFQGYASVVQEGPEA